MESLLSETLSLAREGADVGQRASASAQWPGTRGGNVDPSTATLAGEADDGTRFVISGVGTVTEPPEIR